MEKKPLEKEKKKRHKHFPFYYVRIELRRKSHNFSQFIIGPFSGEGGQIILQSGGGGGGGGSDGGGGWIFIPSLPFLSPFPSPSLVGNYIQVFSHIMPAIPVTPDMRRRRRRRPVQGKGGGGRQSESASLAAPRFASKREKRRGYQQIDRKKLSEHLNA